MKRKNLLHGFIGLSSVGFVASLSNLRTAIAQAVVQVLTVSESTGRVGIRNTQPAYTLDVKHANGSPEGETPNNGLALSHDRGPTWALYVSSSDGSITFYKDRSYVLSITSDGRIRSLSDENRKKNVEDMSDGQLAKLLKLQLKNFQYLNQEDNKQHPGLIAQEAIEIFPEVVSNQINDDGENSWTISYSDFIPFLIKGVQEQHSIIEQKGAEISALKIQQEEILKRLQRLEQKNSSSAEI